MDDKEHSYHDFYPRDDRLILSLWILRIMLWVVLLLFVAVATRAFAAPVFKNVGNDGNPLSLRLLHEPCTNEKVLAHLKAGVKPEYIPKFQAAILHFGRKDWASCWIEIQDHVLSIDEEGYPLNPPSGIPRFLFKEDAV